jgi:hypothetical protein
MSCLAYFVAMKQPLNALVTGQRFDAKVVFAQRYQFQHPALTGPVDSRRRTANDLGCANGW